MTHNYWWQFCTAILTFGSESVYPAMGSYHRITGKGFNRWGHP